MKCSAEDFLCDNRCNILRLAVSQKLTQQEVNLYLDIDIETLQPSEALLLAYIQHSHPDLSFADEPRLKGLIKYYRFDNLNRLSFLQETLKLVGNQEDLPVASFELAMKHYFPDRPRVIYSCELFSRFEKQYRRMVRTLSKAGCEISKGLRSFEVFGKNGTEIRVFRKNYKSVPVYSNIVNTFVPSLNDMVLMSFERIRYKLRHGCSHTEISQEIWDLYSLLSLGNISLDKKKLMNRYKSVMSFINEVLSEHLLLDV